MTDAPRGRGRPRLDDDERARRERERDKVKKSKFRADGVLKTLILSPIQVVRLDYIHAVGGYASIADLVAALVDPR